MMKIEKRMLSEWKFAVGETKECLENSHIVQIPHTWNIEGGTEEYWGIGWYQTELEVPEEWLSGCVRLYFHSVYHDAKIYVNGELAGEHKNSGYTPFTVNISEYIKEGKNIITVEADNRFSPDMLPVNRSFDWANDGGIIRPVELWVTGKQYIKELTITAKPVIVTKEERQDRGLGIFGIEAVVGQPEKMENLQLEWQLAKGCDGEKEIVKEGMVQVGTTNISTENMILDDIEYWHFDAPTLYTVKVSLKKDGELLDQKEKVVGFRDFHIQGRRFFLNGEPVRVCGTEWMPGSDPMYGMAETKEQLEKMLRCLKGTNCVFTRSHWQQDDWVFDWCDRHGMMIQEEVPFWGSEPQKAGEQQLRIFKQQIGEMIKAHKHHPSIIAWGVGNELDGQCDETIQYIKDAIAYAHVLDPNRPASYVTNRVYENPAKDGTTDGDFMMINDYIGTWHGDLDQYAEWNKVVKMNPDKPMVPSEFGLCEPAFSGGDARRNEIFLEKMTCYRKYPNIAGTIYFCLNDYRTQMGEEGEGKFCQRVHGSTDLCGNPKPSYYTVSEECAPVILEKEGSQIKIICRNNLPSYTVQGYSLLVLDKENKKEIRIPKLLPGMSWTTILEKGDVAVRIVRPNGEGVVEK